MVGIRIVTDVINSSSSSSSSSSSCSTASSISTTVTSTTIHLLKVCVAFSEEIFAVHRKCLE